MSADGSSGAPGRLQRILARTPLVRDSGPVPDPIREPGPGGHQPRVVVPGRFGSWDEWARRRHAGVCLDPRGLDMDEVPPTEEVREGDASVLTTRFPMDYRHGAWSLREVRQRVAWPLEELGEQAPFDWTGTLFLDTETTGLSAGAGTFVFLTGVGFFEDESFVVRQHLLRSPLAEDSWFDAMARELATAPRLATFFGKAFDQHRLLARARALRKELPLPAHHFDLYWMARRLLGKGSPDGRLRTLEHQVLQYHRLRDLPGSEAPDAWFTYLRGEGEDALQGVLLHNLLDVVSLPALAAELSFRGEHPTCDDERRALARIAARRQDFETAIQRVQPFLEDRGDWQDFLALARWSRRLGDRNGQGEALAEAVRRAPEAYLPRLELAKWWEHRGRNPVAALEACRELRSACPPEHRVDLERRVGRLRRKAERLAGGPDHRA